MLDELRIAAAELDHWKHERTAAELSKNPRRKQHAEHKIKQLAAMTAEADHLRTTYGMTI